MSSSAEVVEVKSYTYFIFANKEVSYGSHDFNYLGFLCACIKRL